MTEWCTQIEHESSFTHTHTQISLNFYSQFPLERMHEETLYSIHNCWDCKSLHGSNHIESKCSISINNLCLLVNYFCLWFLIDMRWYLCVCVCVCVTRIHVLVVWYCISRGAVHMFRSSFSSFFPKLKLRLT